MDIEPILARFSEQQVVGFFLVLARISPLFILAPLFSARMVPARARTVVAVALTIGIAPIALSGVPADGTAIAVDAIGLVLLVVKELLVGLGFAFTLGALFAALQAAGALLDTMIGFSFGALVDPLTGNAGSVLLQLYSLVGVAVFIAINGDAWVIQGLAKTYEVVPLLESPDLGSLVGGAQDAFAGILSAAIQVSAPVLLAVIVTDAAMAVVTKAVPQINVFAIGFPIKAAVGLVLIGTSLPFVAGWLSDELQRSVSSALQALQVG
jgi:flagellar biosynthetic protein FliR